MSSQGIASQIADTIIQKLQKGEALNTSDESMISSSLKYGLMIRDLETEIALLYKTMPKTAENVESYNDVLTILAEVKKDPSNESNIRVLADQVSRLMSIVSGTPKMYAKIRMAPAKGSAPLIVTLDGSDSSDPAEITIPTNNYHWSYFDQSGNEQEFASGPITEKTFTEPGVYIIQLRVETNERANGYKTSVDGIAKVRLKVYPKASALNVKVNGKTIEYSTNVHVSEARKGLVFDASKSTTELGRKLVHYSWFFGDGAVQERSDTEPVVHQFSEVGAYSVRLEAEDNTGEVHIKTLRVVVEYLSGNIDITPKRGDRKTIFSLSALKSRSSDNIIQSYSWTVQDPEGVVVKESDQAETTFRPGVPGVYVITLALEDSQGETTSLVETVEVESLAPTAAFRVNDVKRNAPAFRSFNATASSDPDDDILLYSWDFNGDGTFDIIQAEEFETEYTYTKTGVFEVVLEVTDSYGKTSRQTKKIEITSLLDIDFSINFPAGRIEQDIIFTPVSENGTSFYWDIAGQSRQTMASTDPVSHVFFQSGRYRVQLTVFDEDNNENTVQKFVIIGDGEHPVAKIDTKFGSDFRMLSEDICSEGAGIELFRNDLVSFLGNNSINTTGQNQMLDYAWSFGDGKYSEQKSPSHRYAELSEDRDCYKVSLRVRDRVTEKTSDLDELYLSVKNTRPRFQSFIVGQGETAEELITPKTIALRVKGAEDPDGEIIEYRWWYRRKDDDDSVKKGVLVTQSPQANMEVVSDGRSGEVHDYIFFVELVDNDGGTIKNTDIRSKEPLLKIKNGNVLSPRVDFIVDNSQVYMGDTINFWASVSDPQGKELQGAEYEWDFDGDGIFDQTTTDSQVSRRYEIPGEFSVRVRVTLRGLTTSKRQTVFVDRVTRFPLAAFTYQIDNKDIFVDASVSRYDPAVEDTKLRFAWDFNSKEDSDGDGDFENDIESRDMITRHRYEEDGTYYISMTITDSLGLTDIVTRRVLIKEKTEEEKNLLNGKHSPYITSSVPMTSLDILAKNQDLYEGDSTEIIATIFNANGVPYEGTVEFVIIEGAASFSSDYV